MLRPGSRSVFVFVLLMVAAISAGCATVGDQRVNILYQKTANATGGSGDLYLVEELPPPTGGATTIQWVIGEIRNKDGEKLGNTVTDTAPTDILMSALVQEFKGVYNAVQVRSMPKDAAKGLVLKSATIKMDEVKSPASMEAKCKVTVTVEPWSNGEAMTKLEYEADYTDTAVTGRDELASKTMLHALGIIMTRLVPEIVKIIEK